MENSTDILEVEPQVEVVAEQASATTTEVTTTDNADVVIPESTATETEAKIETPIVPTNVVSFEEGLKEIGFSKEELLEFKAKREAEQAELEKPLREQKNWAEKLSYGINNKLFTKDDVLKHEEISKKSDIDLMFENFEFIPSEEGLSQEEIEDAKLDAFNETYHIYASSESAKAQGQKMLEAGAKEIRSKVSDKFNKVDAEFTERTISNNFLEQRKSVLAELTEKGHKESFTIEGETIEIEIPIAITEDQLKEQLTSESGLPMLKIMRDLFKNNPEQSAEAFKQFVINTNRQQAIGEAMYQKGLERGKALSVGATAPFNSQEQRQAQVDNIPSDNWDTRKKAFGIHN
jgi:hypothetical protein